MADEILEYIKNTVTRIEENQDKQDVRLRDVEKWQNNANGKIGAVATLGVMIGAALTAAADFFRH